MWMLGWQRLLWPCTRSRSSLSMLSLSGRRPLPKLVRKLLMALKLLRPVKTCAASLSAAMLDCADFVRGPRAPEVIFNLYAKGHWLSYDWKHVHDTIFKMAKMASVNPIFKTQLWDIWRQRPAGPVGQADGPVVELFRALRRVEWTFEQDGCFRDRQGVVHPWVTDPKALQHAIGRTCGPSPWRRWGLAGRPWKVCRKVSIGLSP